MKISIKCYNCDATIIKPNPTFVYIKCWSCRELIDVRIKKGWSRLEDVTKAMMMLARSGVSINDKGRRVS